MSRPRGTFGPCGVALIQAAKQSPGTVRELALRAQIGMHVARCTASRMVARGELVIVAGGKPAVLAAPEEPQSAPAARLDAALTSWFKR